MADDPIPHGGKFDLSALTKKAMGVPIGVWLLLGLGAVGYIIYKRRSTAAATAPVASTGSGDYQAAGDSAGDSTDEDSGSADSGTSTSSTSTYSDNGAWGVAAVNWLVAHGYDATTSNQAVNLYLASEALTTQEQAMVNLAITALGAPPQLVPPVAGGVTPVTTPTPVTGGGSTGATTAPPAPAGLKAGTVTTTSVPLSWTASKGATGYAVYNGSSKVSSPTGTSYTVGSLKADSKYTFHVTATNSGGTSASSNTVTATTKATTATTAPKATPYTVKAGDNLWDIAKTHYGLKTNASIQAAVNKIYDANRSVIGGNPNIIKPGEHLVLPAL